jgi:hypothetical protein
MFQFLGTITLPDLGVTATDFVTAISTPLGSWVAGGLSIGVAVLAIAVGYRKLRSFAK